MSRKTGGQGDFSSVREKKTDILECNMQTANYIAIILSGEKFGLKSGRSPLQPPGRGMALSMNSWDCSLSVSAFIFSCLSPSAVA